MQHAVFSLIVLIVMCCSTNAAARADGGQVRLSETHGDYRITVFTSPSPLRAGPVDVSVFLQVAATGRTTPNTRIFVELTPQNGTHPVIRTEAATAAATNKLYKAALFEMDSAGWWDVRIECVPPPPHDPIVVQFAMEAGPPLPPWLTLWGWFGWPVLAVLLFILHRILVASQTARPVTRLPTNRTQTPAKPSCPSETTESSQGCANTGGSVRAYKSPQRDQPIYANDVNQ